MLTSSMPVLSPTPLSGWHVIQCDSTNTSGMTVNLPDATNRVIITICDATGAASVEKPINIATLFSQTIGNNESFSITAPFNSVTLCGGMGTKWIMM